jgi:PmbA protein
MNTELGPSALAPFSIPETRLRELALEVLAHARTLGASDCVCEASESTGLSITTRKMQVETIENTRDKGLGITVYLDKRRGHSSTSDFSLAAIRQAVQAAYDIARYTAVDEAAGLPDADELESSPVDLDLFHPWNLDTEQAIALAQRAESAAFAVSKQIVNSEGANVHTGCDQFVLANSRGFLGGYPQSRHSLSVSPIARGRGGMQRDDWYSSTRLAGDLAQPEALGRYAAQRALARLAARKLATRQCPVLFEAPVACGLLGNFVQAASGGALYRKASFLVDSLGKKIFADHITIRDDPHIARAMGSGPFDEEGVRGTARDVIASGVLQGYFLSCYSARKLGMKTTGNAGGSHNLTLRSALTRPGDGFEQMLRKLGTGLLVTELIGMGIDYVNGDYSRGASGFWVENGAIAYPVEEITVAGNLRDIFAGIVAIGADTIYRGSKNTGSVLIESLTVGGS